MKKAVILFNLGGPDKLENVEPFLFNLFYDPAILNLPKILRYPLAKLISNRRTPTAKKIIKNLVDLSILKLTKEQAFSLEAKLNKEDESCHYKCFIVMRCWHPRAENVVKEVINYLSPQEIILMPLYPQYSAATSGSSIKEWNDVCIKNDFNVKTSTICCYPVDDNFIEAHKNEIIKKDKKFE